MIFFHIFLLQFETLRESGKKTVKNEDESVETWYKSCGSLPVSVCAPSPDKVLFDLSPALTGQMGRWAQAGHLDQGERGALHQGVGGAAGQHQRSTGPGGKLSTRSQTQAGVKWGVTGCRICLRSGAGWKIVTTIGPWAELVTMGTECAWLQRATHRHHVTPLQPPHQGVMGNSSRLQRNMLHEEGSMFGCGCNKLPQKSTTVIKNKKITLLISTEMN